MSQHWIKFPLRFVSPPYPRGIMQNYVLLLVTHKHRPEGIELPPFSQHQYTRLEFEHRATIHMGDLLGWCEHWQYNNRKRFATLTEPQCAECVDLNHRERVEKMYYLKMACCQCTLIERLLNEHSSAVRARPTLPIAGYYSYGRFGSMIFLLPFGTLWEWNMFTY